MCNSYKLIRYPIVPCIPIYRLYSSHPDKHMIIHGYTFLLHQTIQLPIQNTIYMPVELVYSREFLSLRVLRPIDVLHNFPTWKVRRSRYNIYYLLNILHIRLQCGFLAWYCLERSHLIGPQLHCIIVGDQSVACIQLTIGGECKVI